MEICNTRKILAIAVTLAGAISSGLGPIVAESRADVDLTGPWVVSGSADLGTVTASFSCDADAVQVGTSLSFIAACGLLDDLSLSGTIDPATGAFMIGGVGMAAECPLIEVTGTAAPAGDTFSGNFTCTGTPIFGTFDGTRCGNGQLDPGENCEGASACCSSSTCQFRPSGTQCAPTTTCALAATCDGAGACVAGGFSPAGTECDTDFTPCTIEECDGAGLCANVGCSDCCDAGGGCVPALAVGCRRVVSPRAKLLLNAKGNNHKMSWKWRPGSLTDIADFGDPMASTDYLMCVYSDISDPPGKLLLGARAPAGGTCAGKPCWASFSKGYKYKDRERTPDGIKKMRFKAGDDGKAQMLARADNLNLSLRSNPAVDPPVSAQLRASNGECWEAIYAEPFLKNSGRVFFDASGSPSGAFLERSEGILD